MMSQYYACWIKVNEANRSARIMSALKDTWKTLKLYEKAFFIAWLITSFALIVVSVWYVFDNSLLPWAVLLLAMEIILGQAMLCKSGKIFLRRLSRSREGYNGATRDFARGLQTLGVATSDQVSLIRSAASVEIDRREHRRETIVGRAFQALVMGLLFFALASLVDLAGSKLDATSTVVLAGFIMLFVFVATSLVGPLWSLHDRTETISLPQLKAFAEDLVDVQVYLVGQGK